MECNPLISNGLCVFPQYGEGDFIPFTEDEGGSLPEVSGTPRGTNEHILGAGHSQQTQPADAISGMQANHPADPENQSDILTLPQIKPRISLPLKGNPDSLPK
jgi:hypothetical protein